MAAMPTDRKKIMKASKKLPDRMMLGPNEKWAMVDSAAGVPGICVSKECPEFNFQTANTVDVASLPTGTR